MQDLHDRSELALVDLVGCEVRLNKPGGAEFLGELKSAEPLQVDWAENPPAAGDYELSFRRPGEPAWHNDARVGTVTLT